MARAVAAYKGHTERRTKVKTGCTTCRIRKVKCDENKPSCQRCVTTGRTCDGYKSTFKAFTSQSTRSAHAEGVKLDVSSGDTQPTVTEITSRDVELLNRYFSIKTIFNVKLGCDEEARQILQASLTDPSIRYAIASLRALREDFETSADSSALVQQTPSYEYGLQHYNMALEGLATNLSCAGSSALKSALLCCQIFISIEQVRLNYAAMVQHIIQGLRIMQEFRARPGFVATSTLVPAHPDQLPFLDVFVIKLFAAPCKFADPSPTNDTSDSPLSTSSPSPDQRPAEACMYRTLAPNLRSQLTRIATSTIDFLDRVSQAISVKIALRLRAEKATLLASLESWLVDLELVQMDTTPAGPESVPVAFMRMFHVILKIVLTAALDSSPDLKAELQSETDRLQDMANNVSERLKAYKVSTVGNS